jgi:hypothetical protein
MKRFRLAVGLVAVATLVSSVVIAAVEATGDFVPAGLRDRPELARPVNDDPIACTKWKDSVGTCVTIWNRTSNRTLQIESHSVDGDHSFLMEPSYSIDPGQGGMWITAGMSDTLQNDVGHVRYRIVDGPTSIIEYATAFTDTGTMSVTYEGTGTNPVPPYCKIETHVIAFAWIARVITYDDAEVGIPGDCFAVAEPYPGTPSPTPGAGPVGPSTPGVATPSPGGATP